ncbi:hypothetical protein ACK1X7_07380 [Streptomyces sp. CY1]|uniref:hypothetical protein n=1 Tax=Streptomyces sp. CY1 TaxID=3388313 RepID=UPI00399FD197
MAKELERLAMSDKQMIKDAVKAARQRGGVIDHGTARAIASGYNDYRTAHFVNTGYMPRGDAMWLMDAVRRGVDVQTLENDRAALEALCGYLLHRQGAGDTGRVPGWSGMWVRPVPMHIHVGYTTDDQAPEDAPACFATIEAAMDGLRHALKDQQDFYYEACWALEPHPESACDWNRVAVDVEAFLSAIALGDLTYRLNHPETYGRTHTFVFEPPAGPSVAHWVAFADGDRDECEHNQD